MQDNILISIGSIIMVGLCVLLILLWRKDSQLAYTHPKSLGKSKPTLAPEERKIIIKQLIRMKEASFWARLFALAVSFLFLLYLVYGLTISDKKGKLYVKAINLAIGIGAATGFGRLHKKCSDEVAGLL